MKAVDDARKELNDDVENLLSNLNSYFEKLPKSIFAEKQSYNIYYNYNLSLILLEREMYHEITPLLFVERCSSVTAWEKYARQVIEKVFEKLKDDPDVEIPGEGKFVTKAI